MISADSSNILVAITFNRHVVIITRLKQRFQCSNSPAARSTMLNKRRQDQHICDNHLRNRFMTASETTMQTKGRH
ncbi:hypothetical protein MAR_013636, partial [Mya arenaria]